MQNVPAFIVAKTDLKRKIGVRARQFVSHPPAFPMKAPSNMNPLGYIVLNDEATDTFGRFSMEGTFFPNLDAGVTAEFEVGFMHNCKSGSRQVHVLCAVQNADRFSLHD